MLLGLTLSACGSGSGSDGRLGWKVAAKAPFTLEFTRGGTRLLTDATGPAGPGSRLSYTLADGSQHTLTSLIGARAVRNGTQYRVRTDEPGRTSTVTVTRARRAVHVAWRLVPANGVSTVYSAFKSDAASEHFVGTGIDHAGVDLNGQLVQLKVAYSCGRSIVTPFFASSAGYGVFYDTSAVGHMQFRGTHDGMACNDSNSANPLCTVVPGADRVQACFKASSLDYDVFAGSPTQVVADYRVTAGRMPMPAPSEFAAIKWRDRVSGSSELLADVAQFKRLGIPLGTILLDNPWERGGCWGALHVRFALRRPGHARPPPERSGGAADGVGLAVGDDHPGLPQHEWVPRGLDAADTAGLGCGRLHEHRGAHGVSREDRGARAARGRRVQG